MSHHKYFEFDLPQETNTMEKVHRVVLPVSTASTSPWSPKAQGKPNKLRKELAVFLGEFIGTFMFLFFAFTGTQLALESATMNPFASADDDARPQVAKLVYIALSFGVALAVNVAIFADISGGMFNPAVTAGMWVVSLIRWDRALHSVVAQLLASISASFVVSALLPGPLPVHTALDPSMSIARGLFLEAFLTAQLVLTVLMLPAGATKPLYAGMALFIAEMTGVFFTGGSLNPARSLGPAVVVGFQSYHWIYWVGPVLGAGMGAGAFALVKSVDGE